jgi:hypothetical protein
MAKTCRRFLTYIINSHILCALRSLLMLKHQCMVIQYLKFLKLFVWLLDIIIIFVSSNKEWPFSGQYLNNGVSVTIPVLFMVDTIFLETTVLLTHSRKEVIFTALTHRGQMLCCTTENKSLYNEKSCIMGYSVVIIDCIIVHIVYNRTVLEVNGRHWFIEIPFL